VCQNHAVSELYFTASEIVFVHALRFVEPAARGVPVPGQKGRAEERALARILVIAAVVSAQHERWIDLDFADLPLLFGLVRRHELTALPGDRADFVPESTLEARIVAAVATGSQTQGCELEWAIRHGLAMPGTSRADPIAHVRAGTRDRGVLLVGDRPIDDPSLGTAAADRIHSQLADLRERDPELWRAIGHAVGVAFLPWLPASVRALAPGVLRSGRRREATHHDLHDWDRLNRNPPRAG